MLFFDQPSHIRPNIIYAGPRIKTNLYRPIPTGYPVLLHMNFKHRANYPPLSHYSSLKSFAYTEPDFKGCVEGQRSPTTTGLRIEHGVKANIIPCLLNDEKHR